MHLLCLSLSSVCAGQCMHGCANVQAIQGTGGGETNAHASPRDMCGAARERHQKRKRRGRKEHMRVGRGLGVGVGVLGWLVMCMEVCVWGALTTHQRAEKPGENIVPQVQTDRV